MKKSQRLLSLLLSLAMLFSVMSGLSVTAFAENDGAVMQTEAEGEAQPLDAAGPTGTEETVVPFTVDKDDPHYNYNETDADSVTVYVTVSSDGMPIVASNAEKTPMGYVQVTVPYFDLPEKLQIYNRRHTENGYGDYVANSEVVKRPTILHLYLYLLGVYYLGYTPAMLDEWIGEVSGTTAAETSVNFMRPEGSGTAYQKAYDREKNTALITTGNPKSVYFTNFWGHDQNLMYFRNHVYPMMTPGIGSTADYILLSDGDVIDVAMFSNWNFYSNGAFLKFDQDKYSCAAGESVSFSTWKSAAFPDNDGNCYPDEAATGLTVRVYTSKWQPVSTLTADETGSGYSYKFAENGTYYLLAYEANAMSDQATCAPAVAKVTVGDGNGPADVPVTKVSIKNFLPSVVRGKTLQLNTTVTPANATNKDLVWTSSKPEIATVDENGLVTGIAAGSTTITATAADGSGAKATTTVSVTIPDEPVLKDGYYQIETAQQLKWFAEQVNDKGNTTIKGRLTGNIDLNQVCSKSKGSWKPIGNASTPFSGEFDGQGYTISSLYINETKNVNEIGRALFGVCKGASIHDLTVAGEITSWNERTAGIVGSADDLNGVATKIENCHNKVKVLLKSKPIVAGVVAYAAGGTIVKDCSNSVAIEGWSNQVGGVVAVTAEDSHVLIQGCVNTGSVLMKSSDTPNVGVGGIVGTLNNGTVRDCYNKGQVQSTVTSDAMVGGIAGCVSKNGGVIENCYNMGKVVADTKLQRGGVLGGQYIPTANDVAQPYTVKNCFYLEGGTYGDNAYAFGAKKIAADKLGSPEFAAVLGSAWKTSCPNVVLSWETAKDHVKGDDGNCKTCGLVMDGNNHSPKLKNGVADEVEVTIDTKTPFTVKLNEIFTDEDNDTLNFRVSVDYGAETEAAAEYSYSCKEKSTHVLLFTANDGKTDSFESYRVNLTVNWPTPQKDGDFYLISDLDEMKWFIETLNAGNTTVNAKLTADIDLKDIAIWEPITQSKDKPYNGTLDGNGKKLLNVNCAYGSYLSARNYRGLFGYLGENAKILNLTVEYVKLVSNNNSTYLGGIAAQNAGTISGCKVIILEDANISNVYGYIGGIAGVNLGTIENCEVTLKDTGVSNGNVYGKQIVGGIAGVNSGAESVIRGCVFHGKQVGYFDGSSNIGGIVGLNEGTVENCLNEGAVFDGNPNFPENDKGTNQIRMGGIAGTVATTGVVRGCVNTGNVTAPGCQVGGLVGYAEGNALIENSYNTGSVKSSKGQQVGGLLGYGGGATVKMRNCYSIGTVEAAVGTAYPSYDGTATVENCYYLADASDGKAGAVNKTSDELKLMAETLGEAFKSSCKEYPVLTWQEAVAHTPVSTGNDKDATCTEDGVKAGEKCSVCGMILKADEKLDKLNHDWDSAVYTWNEANTQCTTKRVCKRDNSHVDEETATATVTATTEPTCEADGSKTLRAEFKNTAFEAQTKTVTLTKLNHDWDSVVYTWNEANTECTAKRVCKRDNSHVDEETVTATVTATTEPTCEADGSKTLRAEFKNAAFEAQTTTVTLDKLNHSFGEVSYVWSADHSSCTATRTCQREGCTKQESEQGKVTMKILKEATLGDTGLAEYTATFENFETHVTRVTLPKQEVSNIEPASEPFNPNAESGNNAEFGDVTANDWYFDAVRYAVENGLMNGTGDGKFSPKANTTRGMIVTMLARVENVNTSGTPWYGAGQRWAMEHEISDGTNMPGAITREQLAAILYRYAKLKGYDVSKTAEISGYADAAQVSSYAAEAMRWAVGSGLLKGSNNKLSPKATASRAETAMILMRFMETFAK